MPAKITLTIATDPEQLVTPTATERAMDETLALLTGQIGPVTKMVFTLEFADEEEAREMRRELHVTLDPRPVGVDVTIKSEVKEEVMRDTLRRRPMDAIAGFADKYDTKVELQTHRGTVTFTPRGGARPADDEGPTWDREAEA